MQRNAAIGLVASVMVATGYTGSAYAQVDAGCHHLNQRVFIMFANLTDRDKTCTASCDVTFTDGTKDEVTCGANGVKVPPTPPGGTMVECSVQFQKRPNRIQMGPYQCNG